MINFDFDNPVFFDLETQSAVDLKKSTSRSYAKHESTRVLTMVCLFDGVYHCWVPSYTGCDGLQLLCPDGVDPDNVRVYHGVDLPVPVAIAVAEGRTFVAHNCMGFDSKVWEAKITPCPTKWFDTMFSARAFGLPGGLDHIGKRRFNSGKDEGKSFLMKLTKVKEKNGRYIYQDKLPGYMSQVLKYNIWDVVLLKRIYDLCADYGEADVIRVTHDINCRGIRFDIALAREVVRLFEVGVNRAKDIEPELVEGGKSKIKSIPKVLAWLRKHGIVIDNLQKKTVADLLQKDLPQRVRTLLTERKKVFRVTGSKLSKAIESSENGILHDWAVYYGAHTGRFSSRGVQVHNLPRGGKDVSHLLSEFEQTKRINNATDDELSTLIKLCFRSRDGRKLGVADYSMIETCGTAWVAGEEKLLDVFRRGEDAYVWFARLMFGNPVLTKSDKRERQIAKPAVLGCGYGMGHKKFNLYALNMGVDLAKAGISAEYCVELYRDTFPKIAGYKVNSKADYVYRRGGIWHKYNDACFNAVANKVESKAGKCRFEMTGKNLHMWLPSGRPIVYQNCRVEMRVPVWGGDDRPTVVYDGPHGEKTLYGGLLTENAVQAICRDLLALAMVKMEAAGIPIVLHVHDEIVAETDDFDKMKSIMCEVPPWAEGFPIAVSGHTTERYIKD